MPGTAHRPSLLITRKLPERVLTRARAHFDVTLWPADSPLSATDCADALATYDALLPTLGDALTAEAFAAAPRARIAANFGVGTNHIDIAAAQTAGVTVTNTPGAVTDATADIAMTLLLMTARRAGEGERLVRAGQWTGWTPTQLLGMHVTGKRLGILGMGRIGKAIARRAHYGFGMTISYTNRSEVPEPGLPATRQDLATLLASNDIIVIAVPATPQTHHLIGAPELDQMPAHALLINIARGDIVDEAALVRTLQNGGIAGAGLDVYEREPQVSEELLKMDQVTLLPHLGTAALEVREAMGDMALDNLIAFFEGQEPPNRVTP